MYRLFNKNMGLNIGKNDYPLFFQVQKNINREISKVVAYYRNSSMVVDTTHLCCQILNNLNVSMKRDLDSYMLSCMEEVERLAKLFNLIHHDVSTPETRDGLFYNKGISEFVVADESYFNHDLAYKQWDKLSPIKVYYHPFTDINYPLLNGNYKNPIKEKGYAIIGINIPMLAIQYRAWLNKKNNIGDQFDRMESFILRYPILNCVYRHAEIALFNRLVKTYNKEPLAKFYRLHPTAIVDYTNMVDDLMKERVNILKNKKVSFDELFSMFNTLFGKDWRYLANIPSILQVRNTKWILDLQVIPLLQFWLTLNKAGNVLENKQITNTLLRHLRNLENDAVYYNTNNGELKHLFLVFRRILEGQ